MISNLFSDQKFSLEQAFNRNQRRQDMSSKVEEILRAHEVVYRRKKTMAYFSKIQTLLNEEPSDTNLTKTIDSVEALLRQARNNLYSPTLHNELLWQPVIYLSDTIHRHDTPYPIDGLWFVTPTSPLPTWNTDSILVDVWPIEIETSEFKKWSAWDPVIRLDHSRPKIRELVAKANLPFKVDYISDMISVEDWLRRIEESTTTTIFVLRLRPSASQ